MYADILGWIQIFVDVFQINKKYFFCPFPLSKALNLTISVFASISALEPGGTFHQVSLSWKTLPNFTFQKSLQICVYIFDPQMH